MATDLRGHTVPAAGEGIDFNAINKLSASINATKTVANMVEADQYLSALQAASLPTAGVTIYNTGDQKYYGRVGNTWKLIHTGTFIQAGQVTVQAASLAPNSNGTLQNFLFPESFPDTNYSLSLNHYGANYSVNYSIWGKTPTGFAITPRNIGTTAFPAGWSFIVEWIAVSR